jgi:hypothetical protein
VLFRSPHVHLLVSAGGIGAGGATWYEPRQRFLVPVRALSKLVRGRFQELLRRQRPDLVAQVPQKVWTQPWVVWCKPWGQGETGVLDYLARYVFRIAITNARLIGMDEATVTFRYKDRKAQCWRTCTVTGHEFMRRFLQHVLPKGFHKVRYYGLWHPARRAHLHNARATLLLKQPHDAQRDPARDGLDAAGDEQSGAIVCPFCGSLHTRAVATILRQRRVNPARASP